VVDLDLKVARNISLWFTVCAYYYYHLLCNGCSSETERNCR